ncbi:GNAT family N-acetyltransferase [Paenibacillus tarimensis]
MILPVMNDEWARRIQQSEIDYFTSRISSIAERSGNPEGVEIKELGNTMAFYIRNMPWGTFNSVKGFSFEDMDRLEEIIRFYNDRQRGFQLDVNPAGSQPELFKCLAAHGLYQEGFHAVLYGLPRREMPDLPANIEIREVINKDDFDLYAEIHCIGFGMSVDNKHHFVNNNIGLLNRPGWKIFMAFLNDKPAAVGVMHIKNSIASCTLAATAPEYRRQGLQSALLQTRMHEAFKADCELVVAQADFGSTSQNNMQRAGMQIAWTRAVWTPLQK